MGALAASRRPAEVVLRMSSGTHRNLFSALVAMSLCSACDQGGEKQSVAEALATKAPDAPADYKPNPKPRPEDLKPPTDAEFAAWNRKDPEGEKHLYKWDKQNGARMLVYWE